MTKTTTLAGAAALLLMSSAAFAAPCTTGTSGTTVSRDKDASKSSNVDPNTTAKTTPGAKSESPGTVGAMNNAGTATSPADVQRQSEGKPTAAQAAKGGNDC